MASCLTAGSHRWVCLWSSFKICCNNHSSLPRCYSSLQRQFMVRKSQLVYNNVCKTSSSDQLLDTFFKHHWTLVCQQDSSCLPSGTWLSRNYAKRKGKKGRQEAEDTDEEEDEDDEEVSEEELEVDRTVEDKDGPPGFRDMKVHLKTLRLDAIIASGLNIARNKAVELFYDSKLRLNGQKVFKKSKRLEEGDYADVIMEDGESGVVQVKRVKILKVHDKTQTDKFIVHIRTWRSPFKAEYGLD